jgi:hypothetical protein
VYGESGVQSGDATRTMGTTIRICPYPHVESFDLCLAHAPSQNNNSHFPSNPFIFHFSFFIFHFSFFIFHFSFFIFHFSFFIFHLLSSFFFFNFSLEPLNILTFAREHTLGTTGIARVCSMTKPADFLSYPSLAFSVSYPSLLFHSACDR